MAKITQEEYEEWPTLPADSIVLCKVDSTFVEDVAGRNGTWQKLKFTFKILQVLSAGDGGSTDRFDKLIGEKLYGSVPFKFNDSAENKLKQWTEAILNMETTIGFELDTDYFDNRMVRVITSTYEKKTAGQVRINTATGKPFLGHQAEALLPYKGGDATPPVPQVAAPDPWAAQQQQPVGANAGGQQTAWSDDPPPF